MSVRLLLLGHIYSFVYSNSSPGCVLYFLFCRRHHSELFVVLHCQPVMGYKCFMVRWAAVFMYLLKSQLKVCFDYYCCCCCCFWQRLILFGPEFCGFLETIFFFCFFSFCPTKQKKRTLLESLFFPVKNEMKWCKRKPLTFW